jgi:hypothetical protein
MKPPTYVMTQADIESLLSLLGGSENLSIQGEAAFLQQTGCPPQELDLWLEESWIQCDIKAVLSGRERVGPQPVLLVHQGADPLTARLFYPQKALLLQNILADGFDQMCAVIASRPPAEAAEEIISQVAALVRACADRVLSTIEIKLLWKAI